MKTITLLLAATGALFLSSCASTKSACATCCAGATKACCKDAAKKGAECKACPAAATATKATTKKKAA